MEEKNVARQNFISHDCGQNKATVLATRYGNAYGLGIDVVSEYLTAKNLESIADGFGKNQPYSGCVLISCVDNLRTRETIWNLYNEIQNRVGAANIIMLDSGNEEWHGQIVISAERVRTPMGFQLEISRDVGFRKNMLSLFNLEVRDKSPDEQSCAEHTMSAPQQMAVNLQAGQNLFTLCNGILVNSRLLCNLSTTDDLLGATHRLQLDGVRLDGNVLRFDAQLGTTVSELVQVHDQAFAEVTRNKDRKSLQFLLQLSRLFPSVA